MYPLLHDFARRPAPFSRYTAKALWTRPHLARRMLEYHLDPDGDLASRRPALIERVVDGIDRRLGLAGQRLCDLGCGPGLYAQRFAQRGARVTGVDFSAHSLAHATDEAARAGLAIDYRHADYLSDPLPEGFDVVTLIYYDLCALSPAQRKALLARIHAMLAPGGRLLLDVLGVAAFDPDAETFRVEERLMDGFWAEGAYVGLQRSLRYPDQALSLDRYLIVEPNGHWEIFNWLQYFTADGLKGELEGAGFEVEALLGSLDGSPIGDAPQQIGAVAVRPG